MSHIYWCLKYNLDLTPEESICQLSNKEDRISCGDNLTQGQCQSRGCCYNQQNTQTKCFAKKGIPKIF